MYLSSNPLVVYTFLYLLFLATKSRVYANCTVTSSCFLLHVLGRCPRLFLAFEEAFFKCEIIVILIAHIITTGPRILVEALF